MPATSSAITASCSGVARSAARPLEPTSSTRRASNMSSRVKPCSAARKRSEPFSRRGGPSDTNVPAPCRGHHHAHRAQLLQAGAERRPAHADLDREVALRRQPVARVELALLDQPAHVLDHAARGLLRSRGERGRTFCAAVHP